MSSSYNIVCVMCNIFIYISKLENDTWHIYLHAQYFQQKVEDMYKILVGISRELANIKQIMAEEGNNLHLYIISYLQQTRKHSNNEELLQNLALVSSKVIIQSFQIITLDLNSFYSDKSFNFLIYRFF